VQEIEIIIKKEKFLPVYHHLLGDEIFDIDLMWGGRDSGKSRHIAMQLVVECLRADYFKCILIRQTLNTVADSQFSLIESVCEQWGISHLFKFTRSRLEIICVLNGNGFYGRGLDKVARIKSFNNPSCAWIEELAEISASDFVVILTSLRTNKGRVKTWGSFNPECDVNYTDFWLYQDWFSHTEEKSFTWVRTISTPKGDVDFKVRATHATYRDNPYVDPQRMALYESYKSSKNNAYWYQVYTLGNWGYRKPDGRFFKCFDDGVHTLDLLSIPQIKEGDWTLHITADNNVAPYVAVQIWIVDLKGKALLQIGELPCIEPNNTAAKAGKQVVDYLVRRNYNDKVYIYGDPSANAKSTTDDNGLSFFDKFIGVIKDAGYEYVNRVGRSAPSISQSASFINEIFEHNYENWKIYIDKSCVKSVEDYNMCVEATDGSMIKKRITVKQTGATYERWGHFSDCFRYTATTILREEYTKFLQRRSGVPRPGGVAKALRVKPKLG